MVVSVDSLYDHKVVMASVGVVQGDVVLPTDLKNQRTVTESTYSSTGTVIIEEIPYSGSARAILDDSDDDLSIGPKGGISSLNGGHFPSSEENSFRELNESIERDHMSRDNGSTSPAGSGLLSFDELKEEYDDFDEKSEHWQNKHHHHHIDDILYMHVTESEASDILLRGIDIAERWADDGLLALYKGQYMMRNKLFENASEKFEESLGYYRERTPDYCLEHGTLDLTPHICALLIESYYMQGILHRSISVAKEWIEKYPTSPSPRCALAWILREMEQWGDSIATCSGGINKLPETEMIMTLYDIRGKNYFTLGEYEKAAKDFEKVKNMSAKGLTRFTPDKPEFINIGDANPRHAAPKIIPRARPDLTLRATKVNQRVMELYSMHLAENRASTPQPSPQTYEELLNAQLSTSSNRATPTSSMANSRNSAAVFFQSLYKTAKAELRAQDLEGIKNCNKRRVYAVNEKAGRNCAKCHSNYDSQGVEAKDTAYTPTKLKGHGSPKRLLTHRLGEYL